MVKHDRRKTSNQPRSSQPVAIQASLPVLGMINGVREAFPGLCIADWAPGPRVADRRSDRSQRSAWAIAGRPR